MSVAVASGPNRLPKVRAAVDGRPPSIGWRAEPPPINQPTLNLLDDRQPVAVHVVHPAPDTGTPPAHLAAAEAWAPTIALVLFETALGHRPCSQLIRWVDERVLATVSLHARLRRTGARNAARTDTRTETPTGPQAAKATMPPATVASVRLQSPAAGVVEVAAHLKQGNRSVVLAFRLQTRGQRWLCTAVELGPRDAWPLSR